MTWRAAYRLWVVLLIACLPGFAASQSTGLTRLTDRDDLLGWEAVGRLDIQDSGYCTGTLISPDLVLTAAHCVFDRANTAPRPPETLVFRAGLRDGVAIAERKIGQIAVPPQYVPNGPRTMQQIRHDVALLVLTRPITSAEADPFILYSGQSVGTAVSVTSYGRGRDQALSRQRECNIVGQSNDLIAFDCDVTFGSSGAPVFAKAGSRGRIVSVISGGGIVGGREVALGMSLPRIVEQLKAQLRATRSQPKAVIRRLSVGDRSQSSGAKFIKN